MSTYPPPYHQIKDKEKMIALIKKHPFGMLVSVKDGKPHVTHIPIIYNDTTGKLVAHIDKYNPQVSSLTEGAEITVVFKGPDCYISPSVYSTKQLPTWNYMIVHITGTISLIHDKDAAKETMINMTKFLEGEDQKFILDKDNRGMRNAINYIKAFEVNITHWEGKFKLSQDKNSKDQELAKEELKNKSREDITGFIDEMYHLN